MIMLKSINGKEFCLNCELIYKMERAHDTIITLTNGNTLRVIDDLDFIVEKIIAYKRQIYRDLPKFTGGEE